MIFDWQKPSPLTLDDFLDKLTVPELQQRLKAIDASRGWPTRKAEVIAALKLQLAGANLERIWQQLTPLEQHTVSEALHHDAGEYQPDRIGSKYGELPQWSDRRQGNKRYSAPLTLLFYSHRRYGYGLHIPELLRQRLQEFVPKPQQYQARFISQPEALQVDTKCDDEADCEIRLIEREIAAQSELRTLLLWLQQGKLRLSAKTGKPSAALLKQLSAAIGEYYDHGNDAAPGTEHIKAFAWCMLLQAAPFVNNRNGKLSLKRTEHDIAGRPAAEVLRSLWQSWLEQSFFDEFSRVDLIKGQTGKGKSSLTKAAQRRGNCADALKQAASDARELQLAADDNWLSFDEFSRALIAQGHNYLISNDPWTLYVGDARYGALGYSGNDDWSICEGRYLRCVLLEYAATLGLLDVVIGEPDRVDTGMDKLDLTFNFDCLSRYDGLCALRITPLGEYCLGLSQQYQTKAQQANTPLKVTAKLALEFDAPPHGAEQLLLESYASELSPQLWQLDRDKLMQTLESGGSLDPLRQFITERDPQPFLPEAVEKLFTHCSLNARAVTVDAPALLLNCQDEATAKKIAGHPTMAKLCLLAGRQHLVIKAKHESTFRQALHDLGMGMPGS